jgi:hypothetical protein
VKVAMRFNYKYQKNMVSYLILTLVIPLS